MDYDVTITLTKEYNVTIWDATSLQDAKEKLIEYIDENNLYNTTPDSDDTTYDWKKIED